MQVRKYSPQDVGSFQRIIQICLNFMDTLDWISYSESAFVYSEMTGIYKSK